MAIDNTDMDAPEYLESSEEPKGSIQFFSEEIDFELEGELSNRLVEWIGDTLAHEGFVLDEISYIFCSDGYLLGINQEYLQHDTFTDIITFPYHESGQRVSGDIYISVERVRENASDLEIEFETELRRVIIHGVLHMMGYVDGTDADKAFMRQKEDFYLARFK